MAESSAAVLGEDAKRRVYGTIANDLAAFFKKYPGVDVCGRMATIKCVQRPRPTPRLPAAYSTARHSVPAAIGPPQIQPPTARSSFLKYHWPEWCFVGFYTVRDAGSMLQIGPYQGRVLATALIAFGRGVCGTAAAEGVTQVVDDVGTCANYIPCDDVTRSEIVVPVFGRNSHSEPEAAPTAERKLIAVLDIDSERLAAFDAVDAECLQSILTTYF